MNHNQKEVIAEGNTNRGGNGGYIQPVYFKSKAYEDISHQRDQHSYDSTDDHNIYIELYSDIDTETNYDEISEQLNQRQIELKDIETAPFKDHLKIPKEKETFQFSEKAHVENNRDIIGATPGNQIKEKGVDFKSVDRSTSSLNKRLLCSLMLVIVAVLMIVLIIKLGVEDTDKTTESHKEHSDEPEDIPSNVTGTTSVLPVVSGEQAGTTKTTTIPTSSEVSRTQEVTELPVQTTRKDFPDFDISCPSVQQLKLNSYVGMINCSIPQLQGFTSILVYHDTGFKPDSIFRQEVYINGTTITTIPNVNIQVILASSSNTLTIMLSNVSCTMEGKFYIKAFDDGIEISYSVVQLNVAGDPDYPTITLSPDQVIDLIFNDDPNDFYRVHGVHTCIGNTGYPGGLNWEIEITYDNGNTFTKIPANDIAYHSRTNMINKCQNIQTITFGLRFKENMQMARLRCVIPEENKWASLSEELLLIPRNICNCGDNTFRGHPFSCKRRVQCVKTSVGMFPTGIACAEGKCRNSLNGICSADCSEEVCNEPVPEDFCEPLVVPPIAVPSTPEVACNSSDADRNSGPTEMTCIINNSSFVLVTITFRALSKDSREIGTINSAGEITDTDPDDGVTFIYTAGVLSFRIDNATCDMHGYYGVKVNYSDTEITVEGQLKIIYPASKPTLTLNPDQIMDLGFYRGGFEHSCKGELGDNPSGYFVTEFVYENGTVEFLTKDTQKTFSETCQGKSEFKFGIVFTSDMNHGKVRCRVEGYTGNDTVVEEPVALIPRSICECGEDNALRGNPSSCQSYVACREINSIMYPYGRLCAAGLCRNSFTGICDRDCSDDVCDTPVPIDFCPTTTIPTTTVTTESPLNYIKCNSSSVPINSGPVDLSCLLSGTDFTAINITFTSSDGSSPSTPIADLTQDGITYRIVSNNIQVSRNNDFVIITIQNGTCQDDGTFHLVLNVDEDTASADVSLTVNAHPNGDLLLKLDPDQIVGLTTERLDRLHSCEANIGNPAGTIEVEIRRQGTSSFIPVEHTSHTVDSVLNCAINRKLEFWIAFDATMYNATLRCKAENSNFVDRSPKYSNLEDLALIGGDFCDNRNDTSYHHPTDCNKFVTCSNGNPLGKACSIDILCFRPDIKNCDFCYNVDTCP